MISDDCGILGDYFCDLGDREDLWEVCDYNILVQCYVLFEIEANFELNVTSLEVDLKEIALVF